MPKHWLAGFKAWFVLGVAMLVILGSCLPEKSHAQESRPEMVPLTATHDGASVTISEQPCSFEILNMVEPQYRHLLLGGSGVLDGKRYALCWAKVDDSIVFVWEDKMMGRLPAAMFRAHPGI